MDGLLPLSPGPLCHLGRVFEKGLGLLLLDQGLLGLHLLELLLQQDNFLLNNSSICFNLSFSRTTHPNTTFLALKVSP